MLTKWFVSEPAAVNPHSHSSNKSIVGLCRKFVEIINHFQINVQ